MCNKIFGEFLGSLYPTAYRYCRMALPGVVLGSVVIIVKGDKMKNIGPVFCGILGVIAIILAIGIGLMEKRNNRIIEKYEQHLRAEHSCTHYVE